MCSIMKPSGVGGQAVIEGVMMRNKDIYATAVRKPDNEIAIEKSTYISIAEKIKLFKLPIFRGMLAFMESFIIGTKTLTFSSSFFEDEEEVKPTKVESALQGIFKEKAEAVVTGITFVISILLAIGIFIVLPGFVANYMEKLIDSNIILTLIEGLIRILIFIAYVIVISQIKDIKRMFMYHGAEHKTINCIENGFELTVENVRWQSKQHKRCGTSFLFIVMFVSIIFFIFIRVEQEWLRYLIRILLIPIIAGVSYEFIRFAGRSNSVVGNILSKPGLWMQRLTTKEPDDAMIEVAIQSVEAVFDWKGFIDTSKSTKKASKNKNSSSNSKNNSKNNSLKNSTDKNTGKTSSKKATAIKASEVKETEDKVTTRKRNSGKNSNSVEPTMAKNQKIDNNQEESIIEQDVTSALDIDASAVIDRESKKQTKKPSSRKQSGNDKEKAKVEIAITMEKASDVRSKDIFDDEEDDEILRALDRYLIEKENATDKE